VATLVLNPVVMCRNVPFSASRYSARWRSFALNNRISPTITHLIAAISELARLAVGVPQVMCSF